MRRNTIRATFALTLAGALVVAGFLELKVAVDQAPPAESAISVTE